MDTRAASKDSTVALSGCPLDGNACAIGIFAAKPGLGLREMTLVNCFRNPPPPGQIRHATLRGANEREFIYVDVFDSPAALANALVMYQQNPDTIAPLAGAIEGGGEAWVGPVACIPPHIIPRRAVLDCLRGTHVRSATVAPRRSDDRWIGAGDDPVPETEVVFAARHWQHVAINWHAGAAFEPVCSALAHGFAAQPVHFEMAGAPGRGYGRHRYTFQHTPHEAVRQAPEDVVKLQSDAEGVAVAATILGAEGFGNLRLKSAAGTATPRGRPSGLANLSVSSSSDESDAPPGSARQRDAVETGKTATKPRRPPPLCAQVVEPDGRRRRCFVEARRIRGLEIGDVVVVAPPPPPPTSVVTTATTSTASTTMTLGCAASDDSRSAKEPLPLVVGSVTAVSKWSRRKAARNAGSAAAGAAATRVQRRATVADLGAVEPLEPCPARSVALARLAFAPCTGLYRSLSRDAIFAEIDPATIVDADHRPDGAAVADSSMEALRTAIAPAIGVPPTSLFRVVRQR